MPIQYGEIFERAGVPGMGRQGSGWCGLNPEKVLVLMGHQAFFQRDAQGWYYEVPNEGPQPKRAASAVSSLRMIESYFAPDKPIILLVGIFTNDGGIKADGTWESSKFKEATGDGYKAVMKAFDRVTGYLLCRECQKYTV